MPSVILLGTNQFHPQLDHLNLAPSHLSGKSSRWGLFQRAVRVLNNLIPVYLLNGDLEKELAARKIQIQITEAVGRDHGFHRSHWNNLVFFYGGMGVNALLLGLDEEGDAAFDAQDRILREHFQNKESDQLWIMRHTSRCVSFIQRGRMKEAREIARELVDQFPLERIAAELNGKSGSNYQGLALFLATMPFDDLPRPHELASILETSLQDPPQLEWDWLSLALLAARNAAGDYVGARQILEQEEALVVDPERPKNPLKYSCLKFLGSQVLWNLGEKDSANRLFDEGLKFSDQFGNRGLGVLIQREAAVLLGRDARASATQDAASPLIQPNTQ